STGLRAHAVALALSAVVPATSASAKMPIESRISQAAYSRSTAHENDSRDFRRRSKARRWAGGAEAAIDPHRRTRLLVATRYVAKHVLRRTNDRIDLSAVHVPAELKVDSTASVFEELRLVREQNSRRIGHAGERFVEVRSFVAVTRTGEV